MLRIILAPFAAIAAEWRKPPVRDKWDGNDVSEIRALYSGNQE
jgi:hypothetical protein